MPKISKVYQLSNEDFIELVKQANSYSDCLRALGLTPRGGSSTDILKKRIKELQCDISHFTEKTSGSSFATKYELDEILIENSPYSNIKSLKKRLLREKNIPYVCSICGISEWQNKPIVLQLDHINGINNDHRLENLRFLCPNCHSQTDTYSGKNIKILSSQKKEKTNMCVDCGKFITNNAIRCQSCHSRFTVKNSNMIQKAAAANAKTIEMRDKENHSIILNTFPSAIAAAKFLFGDNIPDSKASNIRSCACGRKKSAYGYYWTFIQ